MFIKIEGLHETHIINIVEVFHIRFFEEKNPNSDYYREGERVFKIFYRIRNCEDLCVVNEENFHKFLEKLEEIGFYA